MLGTGGSRFPAALLTVVSAASLYSVCFVSSRLLRRLRPSGAHHIAPTPNPNTKFKGKLFCASETDSSIKLCIRLRDLLSPHSIDLNIVNPIDYDPKDLENESLVVMVASTLEGGKPSPNAEILARWLSTEAADSRRSTRLERCRFAVFGVSPGHGDDFGRNLVRWMSSLGASRILPLGIVDLDDCRFEAIPIIWGMNLVLQLKGHTGMSYIRLINPSAEEFGLNEDPVSGVEYIDFEEPDTDANLLKEILAPIIPMNPENQPSVVARSISAIFFLLGHKMQSMPEADHVLDELDVYAVASLYRLESEPHSDDASEIQSYGSPLFRFTSDKYPLGMGCGAVGCKLFLVGGNIHPPKFTSEVEFSPICNHSNRLYILDTSSINNSSTHDDIAKMIETKDSPYLNKTDPIVVTIHNKIFVLPNNFGAINGINPTIESYDPIKDEWKSFGIFENVHGGSLQRCPSSSRNYKVQKYLVEDFRMLIFLRREIYSFVYSTGKLYQNLCDNFIGCMPPFTGMVVHSDGCFYGVDDEMTQLLAYKEEQFWGSFHYGFDSKFAFILPGYIGANMQSVICHLGDVGGENRWLVVRSHNGDSYIDEGSKKLTVSFDFLSVMKDPKGSKCRTYSITYYMDYWDGRCGDIIACFPMNFEFCSDRASCKDIVAALNCN